MELRLKSQICHRDLCLQFRQLRTRNCRLSPYHSVDTTGNHRFQKRGKQSLHDQFRSDLRIPKVTAPVMILHGDRDAVIPIASGERLYGLIKSPKRFTRIAGGGHEDLADFGAYETAKAFLQGPQKSGTDP